MRRGVSMPDAHSAEPRLVDATSNLFDSGRRDLEAYLPLVEEFAACCLLHVGVRRWASPAYSSPR